MTPEIGELIFGHMESTDAMLLGRKTFEGFAAFWPTMPADDPIAQRMNDTQKFVASTTLREAAWTNSTLIQEDVTTEIRKLKDQPGKDIAINLDRGVLSQRSADGAGCAYGLRVRA